MKRMWCMWQEAAQVSVAYSLYKRMCLISPQVGTDPDAAQVLAAATLAYVKA